MEYQVNNKDGKLSFKNLIDISKFDKGELSKLRSDSKKFLERLV